MIAHLVLALAMQATVAAVTRSWWGGAFAAAAWAISRELTQAEYRWIEQFGGGLRANMPWWGGFDGRVWSSPDQWADWLVPTVMVFLIAGLVTALRRSRGANA